MTGYGFYRPRYGFSGSIKWLIIANAAVFVIEMLTGPAFIRIFGLVPAKVTGSLWIWQVFTYMFLHGGVFHIIMNLFILWMFGRSVESSWGTGEFLKYYFTCGIGAALLTVITGPLSQTVSIGASGAVYGVLLAFGMMYPDEIIFFNFFIPMKAKHFVILLGVMTLLGSMGSPGSGIAHLAHLGGLLTGYIYLKYPVKRRIFFNWLSGAAKKMPGSYGKKKGRVNTPSGEDVNRILDKILKEGAGSLTREEERVMQEYIRNRDTGYMN